MDANDLTPSVGALFHSPYVFAFEVADAIRRYGVRYGTTDHFYQGTVAGKTVHLRCTGTKRITVLRVAGERRPDVYCRGRLDFERTLIAAVTGTKIKRTRTR